MLLPFSAGALGSSVHDLLTWLQAFHGGRVVSDDSYRQMTTSGTLNNGEALGYGFGVAVGDFEDHPVISHGGGINGFTTYVSYYPDDDIAIVVLCNTPTNTERIARRIARLMLGMPETVVQDLALDAAAMDVYVGEYQLGPLVLRVYLDDRQLMSQATGQPAVRLRAQGDNVFVPTFDDDVRLIFDVADDRAARVILRQGGGEIQGARIGQ
ncbi:MAG: beta-lactamase family protein [Proteobacteria bacterium]|nr:beta-lactamase family protein [Pseudomonadota bacterium]